MGTLIGVSFSNPHHGPAGSYRTQEPEEHELRDSIMPVVLVATIVDRFLFVPAEGKSKGGLSV